MSKDVKYSCQNCGEQLKSIDVKCPKCGKELGEVGRKIDVTISESISLVERRLLQNPVELANLLPPVLSDPKVVPFTYFKDNYFILALVQREDKQHLKKLVEQGLMPFPCLIKPENVSGTSAFGINNSRNMFISNCIVENAFTMSLGKDSTVILYNHTQLIRVQGRTEKYTIPLAYVISFGDVIRQYNLLDFLEDLIAYSIKQWKQEYGKSV